MSDVKSADEILDMVGVTDMRLRMTFEGWLMDHDREVRAACFNRLANSNSGDGKS
jgi:hypothetical protein